MLSDRVKRLLTAAVDGELDQVERRAFQKVLQQSEEARRLYHQIKAHAAGLNRLSRQGLPPHFSCQILQSVGEMIRATPASVGNSPKRFTLPLWANFAAALAVMLAVCAGTYMIIVVNDQQKAAVAENERKKKQPELIAVPTPNLATPAIAIKDLKPVAVVKNDPPAPPPDPIDVPKRDDPKATQPSDPFGAPVGPDMRFFKVAPADLPPVFLVHDLDEAKARELFRESLKHSESFQLDLFCRDSTRAFDRVQNVMKAQGLRVTVDALAQERAHHKLKSHYLFFTESLTADEVAKLFQGLATDDKKAEAKNEATFGKVVVKTMSAESRKDLSKLLGVEVKWLEPKPKTSSTNDPTKPLSDSTAEKLAAKLAERTAPGSTAAKQPDHSVLVLWSNPARPNPAASKEVKQFLEQRKERKANAVPLMIIVRTPQE